MFNQGVVCQTMLDNQVLCDVKFVNCNKAASFAAKVF